jgi:hypothetical protein
MSEENKGGFLSEIKNQVLATIGVIITAAGGIAVSNMEALFSPSEDEPAVESVEQAAKESTKDTLVVIQKEQPKVIVKEVKPKKTATEKRKEEFDW